MNPYSFIISILFATMKEHETQFNNFLFISISTKSCTLHNGSNKGYKPLNTHLPNKNKNKNIYLLTPTTNTIITILLPPFI
jgi:homospermidine synthase